jgi:hypothetical protein
MLNYFSIGKDGFIPKNLPINLLSDSIMNTIEKTRKYNRGKGIKKYA